MEKSRREVEAMLEHKSHQRGIHEAFQEMGRRLQDYARRQEGAVKTKQRMQEALVKDIFPNAGAPVRFAGERGEKGPQASTVKLIHPRKQARAAALVEVLPPPARSKR